MLVTSHILESLTSACDRIHLLRDGRVARTFGRGEFGELERALVGDAGGVRHAKVRALLRGGGA